MASSKTPTEPKSTKGRKPLAPAELVDTSMDAGQLAERRQGLAVVDAHEQAIVEQFGDGLPWHPDHYEAAIRIELGRSAESFLRAGRMLLVARACSVHGEWAGMLKRLNLGDDTALHMMAWARQVQGLANPERVRDLNAAATTIGKMIELSKLPPEQFQALADGQGELDLDDVASMTRDELRAAVREAREDLQAKDERIAKLTGDIEKEHEKLTKAQRKWKGASPDERQVQLEQRIVQAKLDILAQIGGQKSGLVAAFIDLAEHCNENELDSSAFMGDVLGELLAAVRLVRDDYEYGFAIPVINDAGA